MKYTMKYINIAVFTALLAVMSGVTLLVSSALPGYDGGDFLANRLSFKSIPDTIEASIAPYSIAAIDQLVQESELPVALQRRGASYGILKIAVETPQLNQILDYTATITAKIVGGHSDSNHNLPVDPLNASAINTRSITLEHHFELLAVLSDDVIILTGLDDLDVVKNGATDIFSASRDVLKAPFDTVLSPTLFGPPHLPSPPLLLRGLHRGVSWDQRVLG